MTIGTTLRKYWTSLLGVGALFLGGLIAISSDVGGGLGSLQIGSKPITVFYWASQFYEGASLPLSCVLLLIVVTLIVALIIQSSRRHSDRVIATTVGIFLASIGIVLAAIAILKLLFVSYVHLDSIDIDSHRYNLGVKTPLDGDLVYIVGKCDRFGIHCDCHAVRRTNTSSAWATAKLERDAKTKTLSIKIGEQTVETLKEL
jgi:hypothetical protein